MASSLQLFLLTSIFISIKIATAIDDSPLPSHPPSSSAPSLFHDHARSSLFGTILARLGFRELAAAADSIPTTASAGTTPWGGPVTIFAPTDSSLLTCPSCSVTLLLQEHTVLGLYPLHYLRNLAFGAKIETLATNRCITITSTYQNDNQNSSKFFVGGVEITRPDIYNDGRIVVHGLQGFVSHLSAVSCNIERMTSLSFPPSPPMAGFFIMRLMLEDAMLRLRISGFSVLALALRVKHSELLDLQAMTVFALDDASIFDGGHSFVSNLRLHIVPNRRLMAADLESLPAATVLPTMEWGKNLVVTTASGGGPLVPMRINYVKVTNPDLMFNLKIAVHGLSVPFRQVNQTAAVDLAQTRRCELDDAGSEVAGKPRICKMLSPGPGIEPTANIEDRSGL